MIRALANSSNMFNINYPFVETLFEILKNELISLNQNEIQSLYIKWSREFSDDINILSDIISKENLNDNQKVPSQSCLIGIDLPTWFGEFKNKKVFFF